MENPNRPDIDFDGSTRSVRKNWITQGPLAKRTCRCVNVAVQRLLGLLVKTGDS